MEVIKDIIDVEIDVKSDSIEQSSFTTVCFISENNVVDQEFDIVVSSKYDFPDNGYPLSSKAYNFYRSISEQNKNVKVVLRSKINTESFVEAYDRIKNNEYYFVVIESKDPNDMFDFNTHIKGEVKLQYFSSDLDLSNDVVGKKIVYYYQESFDEYLTYDSQAIVELDEGKLVNLESSFDEDSNSRNDYDNYQYLYPEAAWIGRCGYAFPSSIQWNHKTLNNVDVHNNNIKIPKMSTTHIRYLNRDVTEGYGTTGENIFIHHQVSLDWLKSTIQNSIWNILYTNEIIRTDIKDLEVISSKLESILKYCIKKSMISKYKIYPVIVDRNNDSISLEFEMDLISIVKDVRTIKGVVYYNN